MKARNTQTSKLQPKNWQDRACRIELADLGLNFNDAKSVLAGIYHRLANAAPVGAQLRAKGLRYRRLRTLAPTARPACYVVHAQRATSCTMSRQCATKPRYPAEEQEMQPCSLDFRSTSFRTSGLSFNQHLYRL